MLEGTFTGLGIVIRGRREDASSGMIIYRNVCIARVTSFLRAFLAQSLSDFVPKLSGKGHGEPCNTFIAIANAVYSRVLTLKSATCSLADFLSLVEMCKSNIPSAIVTLPTTLSSAVFNLRSGNSKITIVFKTFRNLCVASERGIMWSASSDKDRKSPSQ